MKKAVLLLIAICQCRRILLHMNTTPTECQLTLMHFSGMHRYPVNLVRKLHVILEVHLLRSGSRSVGQQRIMWTQMETGMAAT